ncbi:MAG: competence/damage-inducible protein A [bacterium]|nr:competence/damage-inducible protein A [bacterium]
MRAIFIAVGSELLERDRVDTNSIYIARKLMEKGILMDMKYVVGDDVNNLGWVIKNAYKRCQLVIITGGLGPTEDDLTREAAADALKIDLEFNETIVEEIRLQFKKRGLKMPEINTRQAFVLKDAEVLPNGAGTAPGQFLDDENCRLLMLPGPPKEMKPMFDKVFEERIAPLSNFFVYKRNFMFAGITESEADAKMSEFYTASKYRTVKTTILAGPGIIEVHLLGRSRKTVEEAQTLTDELAEKIKVCMADYLVTEKEIPMEQFIVEELGKRKQTLSVAESCTGGGLGNIITNVPGSSDVFVGGVIAYSNGLKMKLLDVEQHTLERQGAVSKQTAKQMADGIRKLTGTDIGMAITGIAGPGGGSKGKPVGLVYMHLSTEDTDMGIYKIFPGGRDLVKIRTVNYCLYLINEYMKNNPRPDASGGQGEALPNPRGGPLGTPMAPTVQ